MILCVLGGRHRPPLFLSDFEYNAEVWLNLPNLPTRPPKRALSCRWRAGRCGASLARRLSARYLS